MTAILGKTSQTRAYMNLHYDSWREEMYYALFLTLSPQNSF